MTIIVHNNPLIFHIQNNKISYIMNILENGDLGQLYFGHSIKDQDDFSHLYEKACRGMSVNAIEDRSFSLDHIKREYPYAFKGDMRMPSLDIQRENGSRILEFKYDHYVILKGKPSLEGLPACYCENKEDAETLSIILKDELLNIELILSYTIYENRAVICRNAKIINHSEDTLMIDRMMSLNLDLPDAQYEMVSLTGAWSRERNIKVSPLHEGIQSVYSIRGSSSSQFNPFLALKRSETTENSGECVGFSLVYSGNFLAQVDVDTYNTARVSVGINPFTFKWPLKSKESFQTPEALIVYSNEGLNNMSQTFHSLFQECLCRGPFKNKVRPILLNNWEGTYFDFTDKDIVEIAAEGKKLGIELFVLDDGWFGQRNHDKAGLGDWSVNMEKLPNGISGLSREIEDLWLKFGLWFEPEMVNEDSELFRQHPEYVLGEPGRSRSTGRHQYALDFSNPEVVDNIYEQMKYVLDDSKISYIKWDMNRSLSEVYSVLADSDEQGMIYHKIILGMYSLYERLIQRYPQILFESCASGGARFDPGMLYYAPQAWTSDDTDAIERIKIQYGTSMVYPISSMGSHVSAVPNHQLYRSTPLKTRADVAYFGTFGYELDPRKLDEDEKEEIKKQISFMKEYRNLIQYGDFYRLQSPFEGNETAWMIVSKDKKTAIVAYFRVLQEVNTRFRRLRLQGLDENTLYTVDKEIPYQAYGDELKYAGLPISDSSAGEHNHIAQEGDYLSRLFIIKAVR